MLSISQCSMCVAEDFYTMKRLEKIRNSYYSTCSMCRTALHTDRYLNTRCDFHLSGFAYFRNRDPPYAMLNVLDSIYPDDDADVAVAILATAWSLVKQSPCKVQCCRKFQRGQFGLPPPPSHFSTLADQVRKLLCGSDFLFAVDFYCVTVSSPFKPPLWTHQNFILIPSSRTKRYWIYVPSESFSIWIKASQPSFLQVINITKIVTMGIFTVVL